MRHIFNLTYYILISIVLIPITAKSQVNAEQVLAIGKNVLSLEDYMLSIQYFNQAIKAKPYLADPYFFRGLAKLYLEDYKGAEEDCSLALERNKFKIEAYKVRGFARQNLGLDSLAIEDYNIGLQYSPIDKYFLFYKAVALTTQKKYDEAITTYEALLRAYPKFEDAYTGRAQVFLEKGDTIAAIADIDQSLTIDKNLINSYLIRADIFSKQKKWDIALENMTHAIKLKPQEANLYINRAYIRYNIDDYFGAMSDYNYAIELEPFNTAALFNRALLRFEVHDFQRAETDFSEVLKWDSTNFHALYNRGLIYLELNNPQKALSDFNQIADRYPKFYPIYYAIAQAEADMGNQQAYFRNIRKADELVEQYVKDPEKNKLDHPTIDAGNTNNRGTEQGTDESEIDVMNRFNQLVTISEGIESNLAYNDKIKGRVQDRDVKIELEPIYVLTFYNSENSLQSHSNYFKELDELNQANYINRTIYLSNEYIIQTDNSEINSLFSDIDRYTSLISQNRQRPVDYLGRALVYLTLKNYEAALTDLDNAISKHEQFTVAYMARAYTRHALIIAQAKTSQIESSNSTTTDPEQNILKRRQQQAAYIDILADYDNALRINPRLIYAWYNKAYIYYELQDYTSAINCYTQAIKINPDFGQAYYNRGLIYLQIGNKNHGIADLSKAGELGVLPSYNVLKRMK